MFGSRCIENMSLGAIAPLMHHLAQKIHTQSPVSIRRELDLGRCGELSCAAQALVPLPLAHGNHADVVALRELHPIEPMPSFVEEFRPTDAFVLDK